MSILDLLIIDDLFYIENKEGSIVARLTFCLRSRGAYSHIMHDGNEISNILMRLLRSLNQFIMNMNN